MTTALQQGAPPSSNRLKAVTPASCEGGGAAGISMAGGSAAGSSAAGGSAAGGINKGSTNPRPPEPTKGNGVSSVMALASRFNAPPSAAPPVPRPTRALWRKPAAPLPQLSAFDQPVTFRHPCRREGSTSHGEAVVAAIQAHIDDVVEAGGAAASRPVSTADRFLELRGSAARAVEITPRSPESRRGSSTCCSAFKLDVTAARFGDCVCGYPKAAHSTEAQSAAPPKLSRGLSKVVEMSSQLGGVFNPAMLMPGSKPGRPAHEAGSAGVDGDIGADLGVAAAAGVAYGAGARVGEGGEDGGGHGSEAEMSRAEHGAGEEGRMDCPSLDAMLGEDGAQAAESGWATPAGDDRLLQSLTSRAAGPSRRARPRGKAREHAPVAAED